jgi:hypothetical protein
MTDRRFWLFVDAAQPLSQASRLPEGLTKKGVHMRGLERMFKGAVFIAGLLGLSTAAFAQADPRIVTYFANSTVCPTGYSLKLDADVSGTCVNSLGTTTTGKQLNTVTLSREQLPTLAAYDFAITNTSTNTLGRLYFTVTVSNNSSSKAVFDEPILYTSPTGTQFDCTGYGTSTLKCTSGGKQSPTTGITLDPVTYPTQFVTIVVKAPTNGTLLTTTITAGGYEGNSNSGTGCCAQTKTTSTDLDDWTNDALLSYTMKATTFVRGETGGKIFTGNKAIPSDDDVFSTDVGASKFSASYDIGSIMEESVPSGTGTACKNGGRFKNCYKTEVSLPLVQYPPPDQSTTDICRDSTGALLTNNLLTIVLRIDRTNLVNPNTIDINTINVKYTDDKTGVVTNPVRACGPTSGLPCICSRHQYKQNTAGGLLPYSSGLRLDVEIVGKNDKNGAWEFD